jgi:hypothetical protein
MSLGNWRLTRTTSNCTFLLTILRAVTGPWLYKQVCNLSYSSLSVPSSPFDLTPSFFPFIMAYACSSWHILFFSFSVKIYLDDIRTKFGETVAETHWRRVLDGFYLNEISPMKPELEKFYKSKREGNCCHFMYPFFLFFLF